MPLLILGGTREAKEAALSLHRAGVALIYSVAGLLKPAVLPFPVTSGGFSQYARVPSATTAGSAGTSGSQRGLLRFLARQRIGAIADLTHPYAQTISNTAVAAAAHHRIPCWRYQRPAWSPATGDRWLGVSDTEALLAALARYQRPFLTLGHSAYNLLPRRPAHQHWLVRSARPGRETASAVTQVRGLGGGSLDHEIALLRRHRIDVLVAKNSGGTRTTVKLEAARALGIPVILLARPALASPDREFSELDDCIRHCRRWLHHHQDDREVSLHVESE